MRVSTAKEYSESTRGICENVSECMRVLEEYNESFHGQGIQREYKRPM